MGARGLFAGMILVAALLPVLYRGGHLSSVQTAMRDELPWPVSFEGRSLKRLPLSVVDQRFADRFPGQIGRFTDGRRIITIRALREPTRMLHSAEVCFRGLGYRVEAPSAMKDANGILWSCFGAVREGESYRICDRIYDLQGKAWTDVSSWYWAAVLGRTERPWYAMTVVSGP